MKSASRELPRDISDRTYIALVANLCETRTPAMIMTLMFVAIGLFTVKAAHDRLLAVLVVVAMLSSVARLAVIIRGRRLYDRSEMSISGAKRFERHFALTNCTFALLFGLFAARVFALPLAAWRMPVSIALVGYGAEAAATIALRPRFQGTSLMLAALPVASVLLYTPDTADLISAAFLLALLTGGSRSLIKRYHSQLSKASTAQAFALQARTDHLTGVGNRLALTQAFDDFTGSKQRRCIAFHYVDLDNFKVVNDQLGHQVGDRLLRLVAERLEGCRQPGDVVVRLGGDEFVVIQVNAETDLDVERYTANLARNLISSYSIDGLTIAVGASVGSRRLVESGQSMGALLVAADASLRQQKAERKSSKERLLVEDGNEPPDLTRCHVASSGNDGAREIEARSQLLLLGIARMTWESAPDGIVEIDSPTWRAYTGQSYDEWKGRGWLSAIHPDDRVTTMAKWRNAVQSQISVHAEYRLRGRDGLYRWMSVHAVPLRNEDGTIAKWLGVNIDIDDTKKDEQARSYNNTGAATPA